MNKNFLYFDYSTTNIEGKDFIVIYVIEFYSHKVFKIYKPKTKDLFAKLQNFKPFDNINDLIDFAIKSDKDGKSKLALNIKL